MKRRALIIYCDNTQSGPLVGPRVDNRNLQNHLTNPLGGAWNKSEILSINNPTKGQVLAAVQNHLNGADYTFTVFSGHGYFNTDNNLQYLEIIDGDISIKQIISNSKRQCIIIDACRGYHSPSNEIQIKSLRAFSDSFIGEPSTRQIFDEQVLRCEEGITVLYAASENESASDSDKGGAYLFSILRVCELWKQKDNSNVKFSLRDAHISGIEYMNNNFVTIQKPTMNLEKRMRYFPIAVKFNQILG